MKYPTSFRAIPSLGLLAGVAALSLASSAQAAVFSFDVTSNASADSYGPGPGLLGGAGSVWNHHIRGSASVVQTLVDDTGAASSVTLIYSNSAGIGIDNPTGTFGALGTSHVTTGAVFITGLTPGLAYDLAIFSHAAGSPTWTVGSTTLGITRSDDWSSLTAGVHYVLFHTTAGGMGEVSFTPGTTPGPGINPGTGSEWSAFQITPTAVPEPAEYAAVAGLAMGVFALVRRGRQAAAARN
jgi:hypothetical protein